MAWPIVIKFGVFRDQEAKVTQDMGGVHLHMRGCALRKCMCAPFPNLGYTAGRIALKFGMWLETRKLGILIKLRVGHSCTCARAHPFSALMDRWLDCAEIWCGDQ